jgi:flagellar biosynthetic protein FliR
VEPFTVFEVEVFKVFLLVMVRISGFVVAAPVLGSRNFPIVAKVCFTALVAAILTPSIQSLGQTLPSEPAALAVLGLGELTIGLMLGFVMTLVFAAIQVGGQIMDMQSGFSMINVFNPAMETQVPVFGFFLFILAILFLLVTNGHHVMIRALVSTFDQIPLGGFVLRPELFWEISRWGRVMFYDGLLIAAPVAAALFVAYLAMGLIGRLVPQVQLFVVGFPLTIAVGLFVMAMSVQMYLMTLEGMFQDMFEGVASMIRAI